MLSMFVILYEIVIMVLAAPHMLVWVKPKSYWPSPLVDTFSRNCSALFKFDSARCLKKTSVFGSLSPGMHEVN